MRQESVWTREAVLAALHVSRETAARLDLYVDLLRKWQERINLVASSSLEQVWHRHILDCGQLAALAPAANRWLDIGSGAGLPGLIVALLNRRPEFGMILVESNRKKGSFLLEAIRATGAPATLFPGRAETIFSEIDGGSIDIITARAVASLSSLCDLVAPGMAQGAQALFLKGRGIDAELTEAAISWRIEADLLPSLSDPEGRVVRMRSLAPRHSASPKV